MPSILKIAGYILILIAVLTLLFDIGPLIAPDFILWNNFLMDWVLSSQYVLNPLSIFTPLVFNGNALAEWGLGWVLNGLLRIVWPFIALGIGIAMAK